MKKILFSLMTILALTGCSSTLSAAKQAVQTNQVAANPVTDTQATTVPPAMTLFFGDGCPHCAKVDDFLKQNATAAKLITNREEVYNNRTNADQLVFVATTKCQIASDQVGIPFLWDGVACHVGDQEVIDYLKGKQ